MGESLDDYVNVKLAVSDRRVLTTKWVANPWKGIRQNKDVVIHSFKRVKITRGGVLLLITILKIMLLLKYVDVF